jgi:ribose/xylose/arabinose/galactoside ABC-type transport system permease subunit
MIPARALGLYIAAVAIMLICAVGFIQPLFFSAENLLNIARQSVPLIILALAQTLPLVARGLDLSQGGVVVATSVGYALLAQHMGSIPAIPMAILIGLAAGSISGGLIASLKISPFVVTLGMGTLLQGLALVASAGQPISNVPGDFANLYFGSLLGVPYPVLSALVVILLAILLLDRTVLGRRIRAIGSSPRSAYLSGIPVGRTTVCVYAIAGLGSSIAAILLSSRISSGHPTAGSELALQAVAASVIGGVSLFGGRGHMLGAVFGALFLSAVANALNLLNVSSFLQLVAVGIIIMAAAVLAR